MTSPWNRQRAQEQKANQENGEAQIHDIEEVAANTCSYFEEFDANQEKIDLPHDVYTLEDLREFGEKHGICPYFLARRYLLKSNVIVYNYSYMLDPKISNIVSAELQQDSIIIFDECHNIDNVCIESFSLNINNKKLDQANLCIKQLEELISDEGEQNAQKLKEEIIRLSNQ